MNDLQKFCIDLPKIELHAHLNGSLSCATMNKLQEMKCGAMDKVENMFPKLTHMNKLEECFNLFSIAHELTSSCDAIQVATQDVVHEFAEDGVVYLELRSTPREVPKVMSRERYVDAIVRGILHSKSSRAAEDIIVKLILSIDRRQGKTLAVETLKLATETKERYPNIVVGLDFSGNPKQGHVNDYVSVFKEGVSRDLHLTLHCAEVPDEKEAMTILNARPDRLGHCTCILPGQGGSEALWRKLQEINVPVEICLTSNVKCGTVPEYTNHHFKFLYSSGHPVTLATDDKGVFNTKLSEEYYLAAKNFDLKKRDLWNLSFKSVNYAFCTDQEKQILKNSMLKWKENCEHAF